MAAAAVAAGMRVMAATSHVNRGCGLRAARSRRPAREAVVERLEADGIPLEVVQGGEISLSRLRDLDDAELRGLTLGGGPLAAARVPAVAWRPADRPAVAGLRTRGFASCSATPSARPGSCATPTRSERAGSASARSRS